LLQQIDTNHDTPELTRLSALRRFALRFINLDDLGYAVSPFTRDGAREALGMATVETNQTTQTPGAHK
jgi:hypothetical protein